MSAGAQYVGVLFAAAGVYTGNALLLRSAVLLNTLNLIAQIFDLCLNFYLPTSCSWPGENVSAQTKRAIAVAMQITIGDIGAIAGYANEILILMCISAYMSLRFFRVLIYRPNLSTHRFRIPHIISIGYLLFSILVAVYLWTWMARANQKRDATQAGEGKDIDGLSSTSPEERLRLGDRHPNYRYVI